MKLFFRVMKLECSMQILVMRTRLTQLAVIVVPIRFEDSLLLKILQARPNWGAGGAIAPPKFLDSST